MDPTSLPGIRFSRDRRPLPEVTDRNDLTRLIGDRSFDLVVAERVAGDPWPALLERDHDYGNGAQAAKLDDELFVFELFDCDGADCSTVLTSVDQVVQAFVDWSTSAPGWRDRYAWDLP